jgi:hypothetical protein
LVNTTLLRAIVLAVISGRQMQGNWLVIGDYQQGVYVLRLCAWGAIVLGLILYLLMNLKIGGIPMLLSIFSLKIRPHDTPKHWFSQIQTIWKRH